jgi:hypothetical protein
MRLYSKEQSRRAAPISVDELGLASRRCEREKADFRNDYHGNSMHPLQADWKRRKLKFDVASPWSADLCIEIVFLNG